MAEKAGRAGEITELISAMLDGYFSTLEKDLVATRAFLVEFDALGPPSRERRPAALRGIARYIRDMHTRFRASDQTLAPPFADEVYVGILDVVRQLACDALDEQRRPTLRAIGDTLAPWLLTAFRPNGAARPVPSSRRIQAVGEVGGADRHHTASRAVDRPVAPTAGPAWDD